MAKAWLPKDPDSIKDYTYTIALDAADTVVGEPEFERLSGTVEFETPAVPVNPAFSPTIISNDEVERGQVLTVWLSGGEDGETSVFRVSWTTAGGREDDDVITIAVAANELTALVLTGYAKPSVAHLIARYPAFSDVDVSTIRAWLTDAERYVDEAWTEGDYAAALMALAAHNMALGGLGTDAAVVSNLPLGVTAMKSGSLSLNFSEAAAKDRISGALGSTRYGAEYLALLRRNRGGARVLPTGAVPAYPMRRNLLGDV